jgi:hypothetical protein
VTLSATSKGRPRSAAPGHVAGVEVRAGRGDQEEALAAPLGKSADGEAGEGLVVKVEIGVVDPHVGAAMGGEGKVAVLHVADARIVGLGLVQDHPVGAFGFHDVADRLHRVLVGEEGHDDHVVGGAAKGVGDGVDQPRRVVHHVRFGGEHKSDDVGLAGAEADAGAVRAVAHEGRGLTHPALRLFADVGGVLQRAADGGDGKAGRGGDGLEGGTLGLRISEAQGGVFNRRGHASPRWLRTATGESVAVIRCGAGRMRVQKPWGRGAGQAPVLEAWSGGFGAAAWRWSKPSRQAVSDGFRCQSNLLPRGPTREKIG